jgi:uncharacterized protein
MKTSAPLANLITLGARDFVSLRDFYRNLGWPQIIDDGRFAARGIVLALFPINQLAHDGNAEPEPGTGGIRFTIGMMVDAPDEVDRLTEQMRTAGARVTKEPVDAEFFTGRSAYLCDPEGNYFEIAWVSIGTCGRSFGTPCIHEHACVRCALLWPDPAQRSRLVEIRDNLKSRIAEAEREGWLGEVEGLQVSLAGAEDKLTQIERRRRLPAESSTDLGIPALPGESPD